MKIIAMADLHIGQKAYCQLDKETGLYLRELNAINILNEVIDYTINNHADVFVFAGDMYKNNLPSPTLIHYVSKAFRKLSENHIRSFVIAGNHDLSKNISTFSGISQFSSLKIPYITQDRFLNISEYNGYQFVMLPTYHTKEEIEDIINNLEDKPTIIIGHLSINNAYLNDWNIIENETCIDKDVFNKSFIKAVLLGHFHKHQVLNKNPLVMYTGSPDRIDFGEENQEKGFIELNIDKDINYKFISLDKAQKFKTVNIYDSENLEKDIIKTLKTLDLSNTIVRIKANVEEKVMLNEKDIINVAYEQGVQHILKVQQVLPKQEVMQITENNIDNSLSEFEILEKIYEGQKRAQERIKLGKEIINKVNEVVL